MEKKKVIIGGFVFFLLFSPLVLAQNNDLLGWGKTYWGMTEDEVIKAIGEKAIKLQDHGIYQNGYSSIKIEDIFLPAPIMGAGCFDGFFIFNFKSKRLTSIRFDDKYPLQLHFDLLKKFLSEKYGPASFKDLKEIPKSHAIGGGYMTIQLSWSFPSTVINLFHWFDSSNPNNPEKVVIIYRQRSSDADDNL
jgi:hypothetical protein